MAKKINASSPSKKAALPRRNKTGKRPHSMSRILQAATTARGISRPSIIFPRALGSPNNRARKQSPRSYKLSDTLESARSRNKPSSKRTVKNPKGG